MQASKINMARALLKWGRECWEQGRYDEATRLLSRLLSLRVIPGKVAERAQFYLGDIQLSQGHYSRARRHLSAAIGSGVALGETHFLMACALEWDDESNVRAAYRHYRRAVQLEPGQPLYSSAYALMRIRCRTGTSKVDREALRRLRDSFAASPDDPDIVYNYAYGLMEMGRHMEAEIALRRALKQWPGHPAFEGLWHDHQVRSGRAEASEPAASHEPSRQATPEDKPVILSFPAARIHREPEPEPLTNVTLRAALAKLPAAMLDGIAQNLGLTLDSNAAQIRKEIRRTLLDPRQLRPVIERLSPGGRELMMHMAKTNGRTELRRLRIRIDGPSRQGPHFARRESDGALDELCRFGLAYADSPEPRTAKPKSLVIPRDLQQLVRAIVG